MPSKKSWDRWLSPRHLSPATSLQSSQVFEAGNGLPLASVSVPTSDG